MKQLNIKVNLNNNVFFKIVSFPLKHYKTFEFTKVFYLLVIFFWFCNFAGSVLFIDVPYTASGGNLWLSALLNESLFDILPSLNQISMILLSFYLIFKFKAHRSINKKYSYIFWFSIFVVFLYLINPNNELPSLLVLISHPVRPFYFFLLLLYSLLFLNENIFSRIIYNIFAIGLYFCVIFCSYYFVNFILGAGVVYDMIPRVLLQHDVLLWVMYFEILSVLLYLISGKKKYLLIAIYLFVIISFSFVRTPLLLMIITNLIIVVLYLSTHKKISATLVYSFISILILGSGYIYLSSKGIFDINVYIDRYLGAFSYFIPQVTGKMINTDSGHMLESISLTNLFFARWDTMFWGVGIGQYLANVSGATAGFAPHNIFVYSWLEYGLFMTFYLLYFVFWSLKKFISYIFLKPRNIYYQLFLASIMFTLFVTLCSGWTTNQVKFVMTDLIFSSQFIFLVISVKLSKEGFEFIKLKLVNGN